MDSKTPTTTDIPVRCILVNYRTPWEMLKRCLDSIIAAGESVDCSITLLDNASGDGVLEQVRKAYPRVRIIALDSNAGFATAVNRGLRETGEPYVLMLNTDAVLTDGALETLVASLGAAPAACAGVAPKMLSSSTEGVIDAVGTVMPPDGAAFSRGIGQCDLGQYDSVEEVSGVCFGAALLKRGLFEAAAVGPLSEDYFLYFEDTDWCMRALSQGHSFLTAPAAIVYHEHSGVARKQSLEFKYRMIELNTLKVVTRTFENPVGAARVVLARLSRLLVRTLMRRRHVRTNILIMTSYLASLPALLGERRRLKARRVAPDSRVFALADGETAWFDTVSYRPDRCLDSLIDTYGKLYRRGKDQRHGELLSLLRWMKLEQAAGQSPPLSGEQLSLLGSEPACVRRLLQLVGIDVAGPGLTRADPAD